jgi:hypothetical protein
MKSDSQVLKNEIQRVKDDRFFKILTGIIRLEMREGHLKWKISDLSRITQTSRPLLYYYFGKSKEKMVHQALETISSEVFGFDPSRMELWNSGRYSEALIFSKKTAQKHPEIYEFFFYWRNRSHHPMGKYLKDLEQRYFKKLEATFSKLSRSQLRVMMSALYGYVLIESTEDQDAQLLFELLTAQGN